MSAKPTVVVIGGAGYMGGCVTDLLLRKGYPVTVYDSLVYETRFFKDVPFIRGDVRDEKKLGPIIQAHDAVIALAGIVGDEACEHDPDVTRAVNVVSTRWISEHVRGKLLFASSCSVYGGSDSVITEESALNPLSLYAKTKVESERDVLKSPRGNNHVVFRFGTLFGVGDRHTRTRFDLVVNAFTKNAALNAPLRVFGGDCWRPLLHVRDAAEAIEFALQSDLNGVYNVSHENYMIKDVALAVQETISDRPVKIEYDSLNKGGPLGYRVSSQKLRAKGWRSSRGLKESIAELYGLIRDGRIKDPGDHVYSNAAFLKSRSRQSI